MYVIMLLLTRVDHGRVGLRGMAENFGLDISRTGIETDFGEKSRSCLTRAGFGEPEFLVKKNHLD